MPACHCQPSTACPPLYLLRSKPKKRISLELDVLLVAMLEKLYYSGNTQPPPNSSFSSSTMHGFHLSLKNFHWFPIKPHKPNPKCYREETALHQNVTPKLVLMIIIRFPAQADLCISLQEVFYQP